MNFKILTQKLKTTKKKKNFRFGIIVEKDTNNK